MILVLCGNWCQFREWCFQHPQLAGVWKSYGASTAKCVANDDDIDRIPGIDFTEVVHYGSRARLSLENVRYLDCVYHRAKHNRELARRREDAIASATAASALTVN